MSRKKKSEEKGQGSSSGEQMDLLDVGPENLKEIVPHARRYKKAVNDRIAALAIEVEEKDAIRRLVREAKLKRLEDGTIKFQCDSLIIVITPRDEKVTVRDIEE